MVWMAEIASILGGEALAVSALPLANSATLYSAHWSGTEIIIFCNCMGRGVWSRLERCCIARVGFWFFIMTSSIPMTMTYDLVKRCPRMSRRFSWWKASVYEKY